MIKKKTWGEFRTSGLLWWVNRTLHLFGWAIVFEMAHDEVVDVYPARVKFRGFSNESETDGFRTLTDYLSNEVEYLKEETK